MNGCLPHCGGGVGGGFARQQSNIFVVKSAGSGAGGPGFLSATTSWMCTGKLPNTSETLHLSLSFFICKMG